MVQRAAAARKAGDGVQARRLLKEAVRIAPANVRALNALGLIEMDDGELSTATARFEQATALDPHSPALWLNLAQAHRRAGRFPEQIDALDRAIAIDPYLVSAIAQKSEALEVLGRGGEAIPLYAALLKIIPADADVPAPLRAILARGRDRIAEQSAARAARASAKIEAVRQAHDGAALRRAEAYREVSFGQRAVYHPAPTGSLFPFLPNDEFFDPALFPWFAELEAAFEPIRAELLALLPDRTAMFEPYVQFAPGTPLNQWSELQNSARWDAFFLWKNGETVASGIERCPATAAAMARLPLLDLAGRGPTVMFSLLAPETVIPPHTGTTNVRATIHLPLVVPPGCTFRVGGETRAWEEGVAWAFDDTIEHEARNDSREVRAILIVDAWNPYLTKAERAMVRAVGG